MKILIEQKSKRYYAGFDSNRGEPVFNKTRDSAIALSDQDADTVVRQCGLLGFTVTQEE